MTAMDKELLKEESIHTYGPYFWNASLFKNGSKYSYITDSNPVNRPTENVVLRKSSSAITWFQYAMCIHIMILYALLFSMYRELERTKESMYDFHMNMINISIKGLEVERNCLSEISSFRSSLRSNSAVRLKREILESVSHSDSVELFSDPSDEDTPHLRVPRKAPKPGRGNTNKKNRHRRRRCHSKHACGFPRATHFIGALPEPIIKDGGLLAPWLVDKDAIKDFNLNTKVPSRGRDAVEITESGLYFIYAQQVYYMSPNESAKAHASFFIILKRDGAERTLTQCATLGNSAVGGEASCFTGTAHSLFPGDVLFLKQRERDRHVLMKRGQTFLGLVLLNKRPNDKAHSTELLPTISTANP